MFWPIGKVRRTGKMINNASGLEMPVRVKGQDIASRRTAHIKDAPMIKAPGTRIFGVLTTKDKLVLGGLFACLCPFLMCTVHLLSEGFRYWRSYVDGCGGLMLLKAEEAVGTVCFWWFGLIAFFLVYVLFGIRFSEQKWDRRLSIATLLLFLCFAAVSFRLFCVVCKLYPGEEGRAFWMAFTPPLTGGAALVAAWFVHWMTEKMFSRDVDGCSCQEGRVPMNDRGDTDRV